MYKNVKKLMLFHRLLIQLIEFSDLASIEQLINVAINANLNLGSVTYKKMIDAVHNEDNKSTASNFLNLVFLKYTLWFLKKLVHKKSYCFLL